MVMPNIEAAPKSNDYLHSVGFSAVQFFTCSIDVLILIPASANYLSIFYI
jgi:hypothetical protein